MSSNILFALFLFSPRTPIVYIFAQLMISHKSFRFIFLHFFFSFCFSYWVSSSLLILSSSCSHLLFSPFSEFFILVILFSSRNFGVFFLNLFIWQDTTFIVWSSSGMVFSPFFYVWARLPCFFACFIIFH